MSTIKNVDSSGISILQDVVLFDFIVGGSTGEKTVDGDDFIREVGKMLPTGTFAWVSKYRAEAKREIMKVGVSRRVNNRVRGYFVPTAHAAELAQVLNGIKAKYLAEKQTFLNELPDLVENWARAPANAGASTQGGKSRADLIRQHAPQRSVLDKALSFDTSAIRISHTSYFGEEDALQKEVKGLVGQAAQEIAEDVRKSWSRQGSGKTTTRVLGLIRRVQDKAEAMTVLSSKFENLANICGTVLAAVPMGQNIEGVAFIQVSSLLSFCMDPEKILGDHATEFDPLDVAEESASQDVSGASVFFGNESASDSVPPDDDDQAVTIVEPTSMVPPLPTKAISEEPNPFFIEEPSTQKAVEQNALSQAQPGSGAFIF